MGSQICPCRCVQPPMRAVQTDCRKFIHVLKSFLHMVEDENSWRTDGFRENRSALSNANPNLLPQSLAFLSFSSAVRSVRICANTNVPEATNTNTFLHINSIYSQIKFLSHLFTLTMIISCLFFLLAPCDADAFFCHSNMCINYTLVCNGLQNCVYPWDENQCKGEMLHVV